MDSSTASIRSATVLPHSASPSSAFSAETRTTGALSPSKSWLLSSSRTSISTSSRSSSSSTMSDLFSATRM
ncbi:Uncharacterised protein [Mycobacteroides abscessus subsp. abscessus]|nr:Uncharacterised protein [Mycobacteroides abscessus subsp. abscessus]